MNAKNLNIIKKYEGFSPVPYRCPAGVMTIGYGHAIRPGETFTRITEDQAEILLAADVIKAEQAIDKYVKVPLTQGQYDALVSFIYNVGSGAFSRSTLLRKLNRKDYSGAAGEFSRWVYANSRKLKGLINRRQEEMEVFNGQA